MIAQQVSHRLLQRINKSTTGLRVALTIGLIAAGLFDARSVAQISNPSLLCGSEVGGEPYHVFYKTELVGGAASSTLSLVIYLIIGGGSEQNVLFHALNIGSATATCDRGKVTISLNQMPGPILETADRVNFGSAKIPVSFAISRCLVNAACALSHEKSSLDKSRTRLAMGIITKREEAFWEEIYSNAQKGFNIFQEWQRVHNALVTGED